MSHSRLVVTLFGYKTAMAILEAFLFARYDRIYSIAALLLSFTLFAAQSFFVPYYHKTANYIACITYATTTPWLF